MIKNGVGLNIYTPQLVTTLGYAIESVDPYKKITIKAYDDAEHSSKGAAMLPIRVGPVVKHIICQVIELPLPYNLLLGRPWIHAMQVVPSTYHQCIKFPHNGVEITILGDANPFAYCNNINQRLPFLTTRKPPHPPHTLVQPLFLVQTPLYPSKRS